MKYFALLLLALSSCTLTSKDVEPDLPTTAVYGSNTVAYQLNNLPIVAHNSGSVLSSVFGGNQRAVEGYLSPDNSSLMVRAADEQNYNGPGAVQHEISWRIVDFQGVGQYVADKDGTEFRFGTRAAANAGWVGVPRQQLATQPAAVVEVTAWDSATQRITGTFQMRFEAIGSTPAADIQNGRFDIQLGY